MRAARVLLVASMSLVVAAATASCTGQRVRGSGKVVTKDVAVSSFTRLDGPVEARSATTTVSGASRVELSGRAGSLNASASGASHLLLQQLQVDALAVSLSGASNADVAVRRTISASLSGGSSLRYRGSPTVTRQDVSGSSSITRVA
jgi:hypothetical protein